MKEPSRIRQVETIKKRHGEDFFKKIGRNGGKKSSTTFTSESAKQAAKKRWNKEENNG